ncbi:Transcription factor DIVARICATA [Linum grandiflorum]
MEAALYQHFYMQQNDDVTTSEYWTREENKAFESALAIYGDEHDPDRWFKVAAMIPGKSVSDVIKQYRELEEDVGEIEAGRVPLPGYLAGGSGDEDDCSSFTLELIDSFRKRPLQGSTKTSDQSRKKGVPWTEDEHKRFLKGLMKYGKGDWRNISRNFVVSKTPTQVASHAQKYFIRQQLSGVKDKRRPSIHDITTLNLSSLDSSISGSNSPTLELSGLLSSPTASWNHQYHPTSTTPSNSLTFMVASSSPYNYYYDHIASLHQGQNRIYSAAFQTSNARRIRG